MPLQEINVEHINFSKLTLSVLMNNHKLYPINISDSNFNHDKETYYVIRGMFKNSGMNNGFKKFLN